MQYIQIPNNQSCSCNRSTCLIGYRARARHLSEPYLSNCIIMKLFPCARGKRAHCLYNCVYPPPPHHSCQFNLVDNILISIASTHALSIEHLLNLMRAHGGTLPPNKYLWVDMYYVYKKCYNMLQYTFKELLHFYQIPYSFILCAESSK